MQANMWRIRISILWIADVVALAAAYTLALLEPGFLDELLSGRLEGMGVTAGVGLIAAYFWIVPICMMYATLVLGKKSAKVWNLVLALVALLLNLVDFFSRFTSYEPEGIARTIMIGLMWIIPLIIVWHVWKWPEEAA